MTLLNGMQLIIDAAFFLGLVFIFYVWYAIERLKWLKTVGMFGGKELNDPSKTEFKNLVALRSFHWGFGCLLAGWVALAISQKLIYLPLILAAAALVAFIVQARKGLNRWVFFGLLITILAIASSVVFTFLNA